MTVWQIIGSIAGAVVTIVATIASIPKLRAEANNLREQAANAASKAAFDSLNAIIERNNQEIARFTSLRNEDRVEREFLRKELDQAKKEITELREVISNALKRADESDEKKIHLLEELASVKIELSAEKARNLALMKRVSELEISFDSKK